MSDLSSFINISANTIAGNTISTPAGNVSGNNVLTTGVVSASGNVRGGNLNTVGNVTGNFFIGDGSQLTNLPAGDYSNANVEAYLPTSNTIIIINSNIANTNSNVANLTNSLANTDSNVANISNSVASLSGNVYANANVAAYLPTYTGNLAAGNVVVTASNGNLVFGDATATGSPGLSSTTSVTITANRAGTTQQLVLGNNGNLNAPGNVIVAGNVSSDNLKFPDNTVYSGNTFTSPISNGTLNSFAWKFSDNTIGNDTVSLKWNLLDTTLDQWYLTTGTESKIWILDSATQQLSFSNVGDTATTALTFGSATNGGAGNVNDIELTSTDSNVYVRANDNSWNFDSTGNLVLPSGGAIYQEPAPISGSSIVLQPAGLFTTTQKLVIAPTAADGDHIHLVTGNLFQTELFLGDDNYYVKLANTGNVVVNTFDPVLSTTGGTWTFDNTGNLTIPGSSGGLIKTVANGAIGIVAMNNGTDNPAQLMSWRTTEANPDTIVSTYANSATIMSNVNGAMNTWTFDNVGNLTVPNSILAQGPVSSPAPVISGFEFIGGLRGNVSATGSVLAGRVSASGNILAAGLISATGNVYGNNINLAGNLTVNGNPIYGVLANYGEVACPGITTITANATADVQSFTLSAVGTYEVTYVAHTRITAAGAWLTTFLTNAGNTEVANSRGIGSYIASPAGVGDVQATVTVTAQVTTTTPDEVYKLRATTTNATGSVLNDASTGVSKITWNQIGGQAPITGFSSISTVGNVTGANLLTSGTVSATGNVYGNNLTTKAVGSWTLATGVNTVSFTVAGGHTYSMWVNGNIPNGICVWNATGTVTNSNVPVIGVQYAWYYAAGNALVLNSIPAQIIGTAGAISNVTGGGTTNNVFEFSITNNSGSSQVVDWGWVKLS